MSHIKLRRVFAAVLAFALVLGLLPAKGLSVTAATQDYPDVMTMRVTDGSEPIAGATVRVYTDALGEDSFDLSKTTDEDGLVVFEEITSIAETLPEDFAFRYVITAEGYETVEREETMEVGNAAMHIDAQMLEKETATLTVALLGGRAAVTIDGVKSGSKTAYVGTTMEVVVTPEEGY